MVCQWRTKTVLIRSLESAPKLLESSYQIWVCSGKNVWSRKQNASWSRETMSCPVNLLWCPQGDATLPPWGRQIATQILLSLQLLGWWMPILMSRVVLVIYLFIYFYIAQVHDIAVGNHELNWFTENWELSVRVVCLMNDCCMSCFLFCFFFLSFLT